MYRRADINKQDIGGASSIKRNTCARTRIIKQRSDRHRAIVTPASFARYKNLGIILARHIKRRARQLVLRAQIARASNRILALSINVLSARALSSLLSLLAMTALDNGIWLCRLCGIDVYVGIVSKRRTGMLYVLGISYRYFVS